MLLEPDLAFHGAPPVSSNPIRVRAKNESRPKAACSAQSFLSTTGNLCRFAMVDSLRCDAKVGGARRSRTADLLNAIQALSQLSYGPIRDQQSVVSNQNEKSGSLITDY
jgi:hypothetical protein